jgi:exo-beta-1,3-glucanase (GH17 family)
LKALVAAGWKPQDLGLCTYGCSPDSGLDAVPKVARELGFGGFILGVWSVDDRGENAAARRLAKAGLIDAVCVGNEGLDDRYDWDRLRGAMRRMRRDTHLPVSTSEQVDNYGNENLTGGAGPSSTRETDWVYPNLHPVFRNYTEPKKAAEWVHETVGQLAKATTLPILVHETGWPSRSGLAWHTPGAQLAFWRHLLALERRSGHRFALFEAFDQPWKHERHQGADVGTSWGLFTASRTPKAVLDLFGGSARDEAGERFYLYDDSSATFLPSGFVPDGRAVTLDTRCPQRPHRGESCLRMTYNPAESPWAGVVFLLDGRRRPRRKLDLLAEVGARRGDPVVLRFWARAAGPVEANFKATAGAPARVRESGWVKLTTDFRRYEIDLTGVELSGLVFSLLAERGRDAKGAKRAAGVDLDEVYVTGLKAPARKR